MAEQKTAQAHLTITDITDGVNANIWTTSTAPTTPNYTFTISNLTGPTGEPRVGDIILQGVYRYTITSISSTTVLAGSRQSLQGASGAAGGKWYTGTGITGTSTTATIFSGSGVSSAVVGDMYLNTSTDNVYRCTVAGAASAAKWVYTGNIKGSQGNPGKSVTKVETEYYRRLSGGAAPTASSTGSTTIPDYVDGCTYYTRTITYFNTGDPDKSSWAENTGLTNENKNAYDAWIAAGAVELKVVDIVNNSEGMIVASGVNGGAVTPGTTSTYGYNTIMAPNYLGLRYNAINLAKLTTTETTPALEFYIPTMNNGIPIQGAKGLSISSTALTFYNPSTNNAQLIIGANGTLQSGNYTRGSDSKFSSNGTKIDLINGDIITKYFRVSQGLESGLNAGVYVHGTIEALDGTIGTDSTNYWEIGNGIDYNLNSTAKMVGHGSSYIQLGDSSTWRLATNRIHTGWYTSDDSLLHFPAIDSKYWDFGIHAPTAATEKLLYIRKSKANTSASNVLTNLLYDIDDSYATPQWDYTFYISANGSLYAKNLYVLDDNGNPIQIGGTDGIYLLKSGGTITGNLEVNGTLTKGGKTVTYLTSTPTNGQILVADGTSGSIKTSGYTIATSVPSGAIFTDKNVQTSQANTTKIYLAGTSTTGTTTGTLNFDSNVYLTTTAGTLHATTFEGNLSGTATKANQDGDGNVIKTTYLKLNGGNVTGAVSFGSTVSADELTVGDLVVNGAASFTNNLQANTINGVEVGSSPKFTDTNYYHTSGSWGGTNSLTYTATANGGAGTLAFTLATASTSVYGVTKLSDATDSTSTVLAATANAVKKAYDLAASKTSNTGTVTSVKVQGSNGLTGSGTITTSGTITISHADTSTQSSSSNSGRTYIQSITLDDYGHVTGLSTATETVTNTHNTAYLYAGASNGTANAATTNGNTYLILMDGGSATTRRKISGSGTVGVTSDANGNITITGSAHPTALNGVSFADGVITFTKTDGSNTTIQTSNFVITQASGATALVGTDTNHTPLSVNGPVKFTNGVPVTMLPNTSTGLFLKDDGTWATPSTSGSATNDSDGNPINTTYIKKSIGTAAGDIIYWSESGTPTRLAKGSNGQVLKMVNNVPAWSTDNNTWNALSTSQAGYVAKAPNDTAKFLRGDASWAAVTKSNVGLGSVDNTADADKRVKGANITTTANAVAYYTDTAGTFGSKASANGALYATSAGGALSWGTLPIAQGGTGKTTALAAITNLGGPYILAGGTEITDSSNLDTDYTVAGTYYSSNSTRSASLSGTVVSTDSGFKMITMKGYRERNILQFANWNDDRLLYRYSYDTTVNFGKWYQLVKLPSGSDNKTFAAIGGSTQPVYVNSSGVVTACTSYANATVDKANAANLTTTANAIAYYTDAAGTFGSKASANGALYATSAGGALNWGTLPVAQGGTGATAARTAFHNLSAGLTEGTADPTDNTVFMCGNTNAATNDWYYCKMIHVWNYISGKISSSDAYVTTDTAQTLTTAATKTFLGLQTFGTNGIALGVTSGTSVTQKANMHYDSTLEAIVFSFA